MELDVAARELTVGAFQFSASGDVARNLGAVERGVVAAAGFGVRLLLLQECALSGYPPLEVSSVDEVDAAAVRRAELAVFELAAEHSMYIAYGTVAIGPDGVRNVVRVARPTGSLSPSYAKRALYGWDAETFVAGTSDGPVHVIDGFRVGVRICWEMRFPELFRELLVRNADLVLVPSCMLGADEPRRSVSEAHLISRAVENCVHVVAANSCSGPQGAPTCVVNSEGRLLARSDWDSEGLTVATLAKTVPTFGQRGILNVTEQLVTSRRCP